MNTTTPGADERAASIDTPEFRIVLGALLNAVEYAERNKDNALSASAREKLIAHINAWGARIAAGAPAKTPKLIYHVYDCTEGRHDSVESSHASVEEAEAERLVIAERYKDREYSITKTGYSGEVRLPADWARLQWERQQALLDEKRNKATAFSCDIRCIPGVVEGCDKWCGDESKCLAVFAQPTTQSAAAPAGTDAAN
jgi:hypothetical protein